MCRLLVFLFLALSQVLFAAESVIIVLGPPGAGKGTFSQHFKEKYSYNHLSAGDLVRREIDKKTAIGLEIADIVKRGENIDPRVMRELILRNVNDCKAHDVPFIIDGYGRTEPELQFLYQLLQDLQLLEKAFVLFLDANDEVCRERMTHRLLCSQCDHIYNTVTAIPLVEGQCDICSNPLKKRINDTQQIIDKKIAEYRGSIESAYKKSFELFPYVRFETSGDIESCLRYYDQLVK